MPVIRQPIQINDTRSIQPVQMPDNPMGKVIEQAAGYAIDTSVQMGRILAQESQDYAKDLVRQATVITDPITGAPIVPPNVTKEMGRIAKSTYDNGMADRMVHELGVRMKGQIETASTNNPNDLAAFNEEAVGSMLQMLEGVPIEMHGAFHSIMIEQLTNVGANVGKVQGQFQKQQEIAYVPVQIQDSLERIRQFIAGGSLPEAKNATEAALGYILNKPDDILNSTQKMAYVNDLISMSGNERFKHDFNILEKTSTELKQIAFAVRNADGKNSEKFAEYLPVLSVFLHNKGIDKGIVSQWLIDFPSKAGLMPSSSVFASGKTYNSVLGAKLANELDAMASDKAAGEVKAAKIVKFTTDMVKYTNGELPKSAEAQELLNLQFGTWLKLGTTNDEGSTQPLTRDHILTPPKGESENGIPGLSHEQRSTLVARVKQGGFPPQVLQEVFQGFETNNSDEGARQLFFLYRDLKVGPNLVGKEIDFEEMMGVKSLAIMDAMDILYGKNSDFGHTLTQSTKAVARLNDEFADETYVNWLNTAVTEEKRGQTLSFLSSLFGTGNRLDKISLQDSAKVDAQIGDFLIQEHDIGGGDPTDILPEEKRQAAKYFRMMVMLQDRNAAAPDKVLSEAINLTKTRYENAWSRNKYMSARGSHNPAEHFADAAPEGVMAAIIDFDAKYVFGPMVDTAENILGAKLSTDFFASDEAKKANQYDLGADGLMATSLDLALDKEIRRAVANSTMNVRFNEPDESRLYQAGVHYELELVEGTGDNPSYRILMINDDTGMNEELVAKYNPKEDVLAFQGLSEADAWESLDRFSSEAQMKAKYGPFMFAVMNTVSRGAVKKSKERISNFQSFDPVTREWAAEWIKTEEKGSPLQSDWEGADREMLLRTFKDTLKTNFSNLSEERAEILFDSIARPEVDSIAGPAIQDEELTEIVDTIGDAAFTAVDSVVGVLADGFEAVQNAAPKLETDKVEDKTTEISKDFTGSATKKYSDGSKYVGGFVNGQVNGMGSFTSANGAKYVGEFKDGKFNGRGTYAYANGDTYVGKWSDNQQSGQGTYAYDNGDKYVGPFLENRFAGEGRLTKANGESFIVVHKDGKLMSKTKTDGSIKNSSPQLSKSQLAVGSKVGKQYRDHFEKHHMGNEDWVALSSEEKHKMIQKLYSSQYDQNIDLDDAKRIHETIQKNSNSNGDIVDKPIPAKRANTVLKSTAKNSDAKIKVSDLWNKSDSDGRYLRNKIIGGMSELDRQSPSKHIETLTLLMNKNGWKITAPEAKKMLETYKQEKPEWFK